jgi:hypothetical protein
MKKRLSALFLFSLIFIPASATTTLAGWEAGTVIGFDTNVDRSIDGGKSDGFLSGYVGASRTPMGGKRWDLTLSATLEGSAYASVSDLDYVAVAVSPGIVIIPHALWTVTISPFLKWKGVKDQDQSSVAFGGKASLEERIRRNLYLGQYYAYTDSRADVDTFSFSEHSVGAYIGVVATSAARVELGYEFTRGDSFRTLGTSASTPPGSGMHGRFSSTFGADVFREDVDRHAVFLSAAMDWTPSLFSRAGYTFTDTRGDLGSSFSHSGFASVGYRF